MRKRTLLLWLLSATVCMFAQQTIAPFKVNQANSVYYAGQPPYTRILDAVAKACNTSPNRAIVEIQPGVTVPDTPTSVSGCSGVYIADKRTAPETFYNWNGSAYVALPYGTCGGDLTGTYPNCTVAKVQNISYDTTVPNNTSMVYFWDGAKMSPRRGSIDDWLPAFNIIGFSCSTAGNYEFGQTIASPTNCTASYTSTPLSASLGDGTHNVTLSSPYTSGSLAFSYTCPGTVTPFIFTLTATGPAGPKTATQNANCLPRNFTGVGTPGATGLTASGSNATLVGATGTLSGTSSGAGLYSSGFGRTFGPLTPSGQGMYVVLYGTGYKFKVNGFCTTFSSTAITFTDQYGTATPLTIYQAPTTYTGTYNIAEDQSCS